MKSDKWFAGSFWGPKDFNIDLFGDAGAQKQDINYVLGETGWSINFPHNYKLAIDDVS